eukprot:GHRR01017073.1.p1 GENE.GHRR01017073.1~~GHRR01017073.1.p1  ORF type:complete len:149 (+),score=31.87 GHRR01017073.1:786-1232(+)
MKTSRQDEPCLQLKVFNNSSSTCVEGSLSNSLTHCLLPALQMGRVRVRQHVNPLASQFQQPAPIQDWSTVFRDPQLPLFVDMGCGPGRFLLLLCKHHQRQQQHMNYLGLEIRQSVRVHATVCHYCTLCPVQHCLMANCPPDRWLVAPC